MRGGGYGHKSGMLPPQTAVQAAATGETYKATTKEKQAFCGICGGQGTAGHVWTSCMSYDPVIVERFKDGFRIVGAEKCVCVAYNTWNGCSRGGDCAFEHRCTHCGAWLNGGRRNCKTLARVKKRKSEDPISQKEAWERSQSAPQSFRTPGAQ